MEIKKVFLIPHFHFDFEWWKEEPHHEEDALIIIKKGLDLLGRHPRFTFVIDTVLPLKRYLDENHGSFGEIKKYIDEGRLELVGGGLVSPDEGLPTPEGLVRQFFEGRRWYRETFGIDVTVAWEIDEFSHPAQIPQIMAMLGFSHFVFCRGVHPYDAPHPTLFRWASPFGERKITAYWWAAHYISASPRGTSKKKRLDRFFKEMRVRIPYEGERSPVPYLMIPLGDDFAVPSEDWLEFVDRWNETEPVELCFSTPSAFFRLVEDQTIPETREEFAPIYSGYFSSRERLKKRCRELQNRLCSAEKLLSLCSALGAPYPRGEMERAWREVLKGDFHDTICGTGTDRVYRKSLERYDRAEEIIDRCLRENDEFLRRRLSGEGLWVFNPCSWERREIVETDGKRGIVAAPPLAISPMLSEPISPGGVTTGPRSMENRHIRVTVDDRTGAVRIYDKEKGRELFGESGNEIVMEDDIGNLWASMPTGKRRPWRVKRIDVTKGDGSVGEIAVTLKNRAADITKRMLLYPDMKEVRFTVDVDFRGKDKRITDTFPFSFEGRWLGEEPFLCSAKADGTWPIQNGALYRGKDYSVAVINRGIPGHEIRGGTLNLVLMRSVSMISLLWVRWLAGNIVSVSRLLRKALKLYTSGFNTVEFPLYPIHHVVLRDFASEGSVGGFGAEDTGAHLRAKMGFMRESAAWERGRHRFEYAVLLDVSGVDETARRGYEFNNPLVVWDLGGAGGITGAAILNRGADSVVVTGVHPYRDGLILRCYESAGIGGAVRFTLGIPVAEVRLLRTIGKKTTSLPCRNGEFVYTFAPHEITTFYIICG